MAWWFMKEKVAEVLIDLIEIRAGLSSLIKNVDDLRHRLEVFEDE